nr:RNA-directed DNA polymerase, eukaryota [Tanacetum cinerariifolium]
MTETSLFDSIFLRLTWVGASRHLMIINVYAPQDTNEKKHLWGRILGFILRWHGETIIMGDFNMVGFDYERHGLVFHMRQADNFNDFNDKPKLIDVYLGGYSFTWNSSYGRDQRNRGQQSNRSTNSGSQQSRGPSEGYSYLVCTTCGRRHPGEFRRAAGTCFKCGQAGHLQKDYNKNTKGTKIETLYE